MAIAWLLIALGLFAPVLTTYFAEANRGAAGYASGTGYLISVVTIVGVIVLGRSMARERRVRAYLLASALVVAVNLWSSFNIVQGARIDREITAARPRVNAVMQAAAAEAALISSGQIPPGELSPGWQPYATATPTIEVSDATIPLGVRFIELMRRAKARELDLTRTLRDEVDASGISTALSSDQLIGAEGRADSLAGIERYRTFIRSYLERLDRLRDLAVADIRALGLPRASEEEMIGGLVRSGENAAFEEFVELELQTIASIEAVVRFVDARAEAARVEDGQLYFSDPATQTDYEAVISRLGLAEP